MPVLDGLRGLAIALVLVMHSPETLLGGVLFRVTRMGWIGVDLFFVLSGFLITGILLDTKGQPGYFRSFYARRILRIFPLYYGFLAFIVLLPRAGQLAQWLGAPYVQDHQPWFWTHTTNWLVGLDPRHEGLNSGFGHLWSLSIEEQFYLVWPLVVALASPRALRWILAAVLLAGMGLRLWLASNGADLLVLYHLTPTRLDPLAVGALLALLARARGLEAAREPYSWAVVVLAVVAGAGVILAQGSPNREALVFAWTVPAVAAAWGVVLLRAAIRPVPSRWLTSGPLTGLGQVSYAVYLFAPSVEHLLVGLRLGPAELGPALGFALMVAATIGLATVSWHLVERPILSLKRYVPRAVSRPIPRPARL
ncbi:MAG TPA: acyltransferase, partial [Gemmatimonadales bacterium]|nr:acyltransferase [Gemmatimonadales bacterium]